MERKKRRLIFGLFAILLAFSLGGCDQNLLDLCVYRRESILTMPDMPIESAKAEEPIVGTDGETVDSAYTLPIGGIMGSPAIDIVSMLLSNPEVVKSAETLGVMIAGQPDAIAALRTPYFKTVKVKMEVLPIRLLWQKDKEDSK